MSCVSDSSCLIWDNNCGKEGNCWLYDSDRFRKNMHFYTAGVYAKKMCKYKGIMMIYTIGRP